MTVDIISGHNLYGSELKQRLEDIGSSPERERCILQCPPVLNDIVSGFNLYGAELKQRLEDIGSSPERERGVYHNVPQF